MNLRQVLCVGAAAVAFAGSARAQTTTGTVRGYVKDQNGTAVSGADIRARNTQTGVERATTSRADGSYILPGLAPATYDVSVRHIGSTPQQRQVVVQIGATLLLDVTLQAGALELQAVTVQGAPTVELRTSEVATNITAQQIQQLPTSSRNFLDLAALAPGLTVTEDRANGASRTFSAGGASPNQGNVFVDGTSLKNDLTQGGVSGQDASRGNPFPRSAIQEYRVITQNFKAEYQKASSAIITATTRSGSNTWTGNALFGYQNKDLFALDTFQRRDKYKSPSTFRVPDYSRYLSAFSVGGPVQRDRLFFFGSYEGNYQNRASRVALTPPAAGRFPNLDTVNLAQYSGNFTSPFRESLVFGKLTYAINATSSAELSLNTRHETDIRDFGGDRAYTTANNFRQDVTIGQLRYNRFWGGWLNETKVDYSRFRRDPSPNVPGIPARIYHYAGYVAGQNAQNAWIGSDLSTQDFIQKRLGVRNDLTYSARQQHVFKTGVSVDFVTYDIRKLNDATPKFDYADTVNTACWCRGTTGLNFGYNHPFQLTYATGAGLVNVDNTQVGAYLQDDWSPTSRLTLNLGVRWDFESNMINTGYVTPQNVVDTLMRYNDSLPTPLDLNRYISTGNNRKPFYGAWQPRVGFSYALDENNVTTVFGGFGIYYDRSIFDFSVDEIQKLARPTYLVRFDPDTFPTPGQVRWQDGYLTADTSVISSLARSTGQPEAFLLDNKMRPPKSRQWSLGVRRVIGSMVASLTYQGQRGTDLFTYNWANIGLDTLGHCCVSFNIEAHGFRNFIYSTNDGKTWYDALSFQLDRPYRPSANGVGWGGGVVYTYARRYIAGVDALGDITGSFPGGFPNARSIPKRIDGGGNDERHHMVANWIVDMPYLFGIQFSGLLTLGSGAVRDVGTHPRFGGVQDSTYFPNAFVPPQQNFFMLGAWAYRRVDVRLRKDFPEIRGTTLGVTVDVFNVFNYSNFGGYNPSVVTGQRTWTVGQPTLVVSDPRRMQIGVEYTF
jgi:outer membrane receptor protein involved in Fe transport